MEALSAIEVLEDPNKFSPVILVGALNSGREECDNSLDVLLNACAEEEKLRCRVMEMDCLFVR